MSWQELWLTEWLRERVLASADSLKIEKILMESTTSFVVELASGKRIRVLTEDGVREREWW